MYMYFSNVCLYVYLGQSAISLSLYMCLKGASPLKTTTKTTCFVQHKEQIKAKA